LTETAVSRKKE